MNEQRGNDYKLRVLEEIAGFTNQSKRLRTHKTPCRCIPGLRSSILARENVSDKGFSGLYSVDIALTGRQQKKIF